MAIGVPEKIPRKGSITAAKLAAEVGSERTLIGMSFLYAQLEKEWLIFTQVRMMRMLVADGTFDEVEQDQYAHTARSIILLDPGYGYFFEIMYGKKSAFTDTYTFLGFSPTLSSHHLCKFAFLTIHTLAGWTIYSTHGLVCRNTSNCIHWSRPQAQPTIPTPGRTAWKGKIGSK